MEIALVESSAEADAAIDLAERVWGARPISPPMLRALEFAGCYLAVAREDGAIIGMCAGFVGVHDREGGPHLHMHSHLAAVDPAHRRRGIGRALKMHQRAWCLAQGIEAVSWTFDPLVRDNARFNLHQLGAVGERYLVNLYGEMDDEINHGDPSDRLLVRWDLWSERTTAALSEPLPVLSGAELRAAGAEDAVREEHGEPIDAETEATVRLVATPADIVALRAEDPVLAFRWRHVVRDAMTAAFAAGLRPVAVTDDGTYVMRRPTGRT